MRNHSNNFGRVVLVMALLVLVFMPGTTSTQAQGGDDDSPPVATLGTTPEDYARAGLRMGAPEVWEDGWRTQAAPNEYEWWYFDAHLNDGSVIVLSYHVNGPTLTNPDPSARLTVSFTPPDEDTRTLSASYALEETSFSTEMADLQMGPNTVYGDLDTYAVHAEMDGLTADLTFERTVPSYRPGTGIMHFGKFYFAWLSSVPRADVSGTLIYDGSTHEVSGNGYHDHNWGNAFPNVLLRNWWWGRAEVGDYVVVTAELRAKDEYGAALLPVLYVANSDSILIDASAGGTVTVTESDFVTHPDERNGEMIATTVEYVYENGSDTAAFRFDGEAMIASTDLLEALPFTDVMKELLRQQGMTPWYTRFDSTGALSFTVGGTTGDASGGAILEYMDFE